MSAEPGFEHFVNWCKAEVEKLNDELAALEAGAMRIGRKAADGDWEDITPKHGAWIKQRIVELDDLIIKYSFPI